MHGTAGSFRTGLTIAPYTHKNQADRASCNKLASRFPVVREVLSSEPRLKEGRWEAILAAFLWPRWLCRQRLAVNGDATGNRCSRSFAGRLCSAAK